MVASIILVVVCGTVTSIVDSGKVLGAEVAIN